MTDCPCGSGLKSAECCAPLHAGAVAPTPLALMRARYAAYVARNIDFVERTITPALHKEFNRLDAERYAEEAEFLGLTIHSTTGGGAADSAGTVEFSFRCRMQGHVLEQHEIAHFVRDNGAWLYADGEARSKQVPITKTVTANRNDPCPCGSGKKYKKCCGQ
jgi:SEC-C motif domain protein